MLIILPRKRNHTILILQGVCKLLTSTVHGLCSFLVNYFFNKSSLVAFLILVSVLSQTHPGHILHENGEGLLIKVSKATVVLNDSFVMQVFQQLYLTL